VRKRILVVEDDADLRELLCFNLRGAGFVVTTAEDGIDALKKARSTLPNLILLDLMLPEMDGFAVCETLRRDNSMATVPIVMLTALDSQIARYAGLEAGANEYVTKPFSPRELVAKLQRWVGTASDSENSVKPS
jgi:DNA-binding response OmpR family regulator